MYNFKKLKYDDSLISIYNYDNIEDTIFYNIDISNLFTINIYNYIDKDKDKDNEYFTISIVIKKPNDYKILSDKIQEILHII